MKILAIGDPHGNLEKIKTIPLNSVELILLTGDLGNANLARKMAFENIERQKNGLPKREFSPRERKRAFMESYTSSLKIVKYLARFAPVFTIYGNVESSNSETKKESAEIGLPLPFLTDGLSKIKNVRVINNKLVNFNGVKIGGLQYFIDTNWVRDFKPDNYGARLADAKNDTEKAEKVLKKFGEVDILVCHQPPFGILDKVTAKFAPKHWQGNHAGSKTTAEYIRKKKPAYVFCGHIHEGEGRKLMGKTEVYNLGVCGYKVVEF